MKTKITLLALCCMLFTMTSSYAQTSDAEAEAVVNLLGVQKKEIIAQLVPVSGKDSVAFWKVYNEYQKANLKNNLSRIKLYEKTALAYSNLTPKLADSLANQYFINRLDHEKNLEAYYNKVKAATNPIIAFEFYQAEVYLLTQLRAQIMQQVPTYGQLKAMAGKKN